MKWSLRGLWWPWRARRVGNGAAATAARKGASDALRRAEGATDDVSRAVTSARNATRRTDRFVREVERSMHMRGTS